MIAFTIPGAPQGKARARTVLYENLVKTQHHIRRSSEWKR